MFTTGLKADDVAVAGIAGLRPLGQVTGACASRSGFYRGHGKMVGGPGKVYLYPEAVAAVRATREQAVRAMARDAAMVTMGYRAMGEEIREQGLAMGAEGIIGVEFQRRTWGHELATRRSGIMCRDFKMILTVAGTAIAAAGKESGAAAPRTGLRITPVRHVT